MKYQALPNRLYIRNRKNFGAAMSSNAIALLCSNDIQYTNADDSMGFAQNNDLFYLSGIDQEASTLLLYPDAGKQENKEILFIKKTDDHIKVWEGEKLTKTEASEISGVKRIEWAEDFEKILQSMAFEADTFILGHNEHIKRATSELETQQDRLIKWCRKQYPLHVYERAAKLTRGLRQIKSDEEVQVIQKAADISIEGFKRVLKKVKPGIKEYELEAELTYVFLKKGAIRHAFKPIVASGKNACALHYNDNDDLCKDGDMILMDFGVCYANYNSDTTRCFPVNGKFSTRQKEVYQAVLNCLKKGSALLKPGVLSEKYEADMAVLVEKELIGLGLLTSADIAGQDPEQPLYKKYFMHGTAHHIGLDVHDVGLYSRPFEAGMVLTCEPGIYIPEEGIGCRLENDYLLTPEGNINLTENMPIEPQDIERLMADG